MCPEQNGENHEERNFLKMPTKCAMKQFDYNLIKVFDATISTGNATRASHQLSVTPAAVSLALQRLQAIYKEELFIRSRNGLVPTAKAKELHRSFAQVIEIIHCTLEQQTNVHSREIQITGNDITEEFYISLLYELHLFDDYVLSHHQRKVFSHAESKKLLTEGSTDLILGNQSLSDGDTESVVIDRFNNYVIICNKENPLATLKKLSLYNFYSAAHATCQAVTPGGPFIEDNELFPFSSTCCGNRNIAYRSDSLNGIVNVVEKSAMIAIIPEKLARFYIVHKKYNLARMALPDELTLKPQCIYASWLRKSKKYEHLKELTGMLQTISSFRK